MTHKFIGDNPLVYNSIQILQSDLGKERDNLLRSLKDISAHIYPREYIIGNFPVYKAQLPKTLKVLKIADKIVKTRQKIVEKRQKLSKFDKK